jgi:VWFA-related protein
MILRDFRAGVVWPVLILLLAGAIHLSARQTQQTPPTPPQTPQFRAGVEVVAVDFMAVAADGQPVADLKPEEVTIRVDGRPRKIRTLEFIKFSEAGAVGAPAPTVAPPFGTNLVTDTGRDILVVVDNDSFRPGREKPLREAVDRFLNHLTGRDRVGVITMPYGGMLTDLTTDYARVRKALADVGGQAPSGETGSDAACRSRRTLQALAGLLEQFTGRETPITIVFVSSGLMGPRRDSGPTFAPGMCEIRTDEFQRVGRATAVSRAQMFLLRPEITAAARRRTSPAPASPARTTRSRDSSTSPASPAG